MMMMSMSRLVLLALLPCALGFSPAGRLPLSTRQASRAQGMCMQLQRNSGESADMYTARLSMSKIMAGVPTAAILSQIALPIQEAAAAGGQYGLLEGKAVALIHPIIMLGLYLGTLYTGYQGLKWREVRTIGNDLKPLQEDLKKLEAQAVPTEEGTGVDVSTANAIKELSAQIAEMTEKRKELIRGDYKDKHFAAASLLLASGVAISVEGGFDTYMRAGKLFPGPHLFAGAAITVLWAIAASLVPAMQKGSDTARSAHIAINAVILGLFTWQLPTGFDILTKVWAKVAWFPAPPV